MAGSRRRLRAGSVIVAQDDCPMILGGNEPEGVLGAQSSLAPQPAHAPVAKIGERVMPELDVRPRQSRVSAS